jgi:hypothetical protein
MSEQIDLSCACARCAAAKSAAVAAELSMADRNCSIAPHLSSVVLTQAEKDSLCALQHAYANAYKAILNSK